MFRAVSECAILLSRVHGSHSRQNLVQSALSASGIGSVRPEEYLDRTSLVRSQQHGWSRQNSTPLAHASQSSPLTRPTVVSIACLSRPIRCSCPNRAIAASSRRHLSPTDTNTMDLQRGTPVMTSEVPPFLGCFFTTCQDSRHARTDCIAKNCPLNPSFIAVA